MHILLTLQPGLPTIVMGSSALGDDSDSVPSMSDIEQAQISKEHDGTEIDRERDLRGSGERLSRAQSRVQEKENPTNSGSVIDWNGPDDPDNPHNWGLASRFYHATVPGFFGFAV